MYVQYEDGNSVVMVTEIGLHAGRFLWLPWESVVTPGMLGVLVASFS